jgi:hypothetical protein
MDDLMGAVQYTTSPTVRNAVDQGQKKLGCRPIHIGLAILTLLGLVLLGVGLAALGGNLGWWGSMGLSSLGQIGAPCMMGVGVVVLVLIPSFYGAIQIVARYRHSTKKKATPPSPQLPKAGHYIQQPSPGYVFPQVSLPCFTPVVDSKGILYTPVQFRSGTYFCLQVQETDLDAIWEALPPNHMIVVHVVAQQKKVMMINLPPNRTRVEGQSVKLSDTLKDEEIARRIADELKSFQDAKLYELIPYNR